MQVVIQSLRDFLQHLNMVEMTILAFATFGLILGLAPFVIELIERFRE